MMYDCLIRKLQKMNEKTIRSSKIFQQGGHIQDKHTKTKVFLYYSKSHL